MTSKNKIHIDFETYSEADIYKVGAWAYSCHPSTEVLCMAVHSNNEVQVYDDVATTIPSLFLGGADTKINAFTLHAWNAFFEYCIWHNTLKWPPVPIKRWHDTAARAAALALPRGLANCGKVLGLPLDQQKNKRGRFLIQRLCKPYRGEKTRDPELLKELYEYCKQDVISEVAIDSRLRPLSDKERKIYLLDQQINIHGVPIDTDSVDKAIVLLDKSVTHLNHEVEQITKGQLSSVNSRKQVMDFSLSKGYALASYQKKYLEECINDDTIPADIKRLLEIRLSTGKISNKKYASLKNLVTPDEHGDQRAHGLLLYHGASTGRWTGKHFQPQNLPRPTIDDVESCIDLFDEEPDWIETLYGDVCEVLSSSLRSMICAPEGKKLIAVDYASIEARVLAWLAGQVDLLKIFSGHGKIYEHTASKIYKCKMDKITDTQRFVGKTATLALGYQGGVTAFVDMAKQYGVDFSESEAHSIKKEWRKANPYIVKFWHRIEQAAQQAIAQMGIATAYRGIGFKVVGAYLFCKLPSGRLLAYYHPRLEEGEYGPQIIYDGNDSKTKHWCKQSTYGGKLTENIVQAIARDLMAEAMLNLNAAGYQIVLSVHDEIIAEVDCVDDESEGVDVNEDFGSLTHFKNIMLNLPEWANGLPVDAQGYEARRYRK